MLYCTSPVIRPGMIIGCGRCRLCRIRKTLMWRTRLVHESSCWKDSVFITLTYSDEELPVNGSLNVNELVNYMKRLRKRVEPRKIKYYGCGEYGEKTDRPHYHAIIFGVGYGDFERRKDGYFNDPSWTKGNVYVGTVTGESCRYVADYTNKISSKVYSKMGDKKRPPFNIMSQGIGLSWAMKESYYIKSHPKEMPRYYREKFGIEFDFKKALDDAEKEGVLTLKETKEMAKQQIKTLEAWDALHAEEELV